MLARHSYKVSHFLPEEKMFLITQFHTRAWTLSCKHTHAKRQSPKAVSRTIPPLLPLLSCSLFLWMTFPCRETSLTEYPVKYNTKLTPVSLQYLITGRSGMSFVLCLFLSESDVQLEQLQVCCLVKRSNKCSHGR